MMLSTRSRGITMLEVIIVMAIFILVSGCALLFTMDSFRGTTFQGDRDLFVSLLQRARAQSVSNMCIGTSCSDGKPHGVAIVGNSYVLFQGTSYATRDSSADSTFAGNAALTRTGDSEVVFSQITGTTSAQKLFTITSGARVSTTTVDTNGRIFWTN